MFFFLGVVLSFGLLGFTYWQVSAQRVGGSTDVPITEDQDQAAMKRQLMLVRGNSVERGQSSDQFVPNVANSIRNLAGCTANTLPANDDGSTGLVNLGFSANYFGTTYTQTYVNNNGNITFDSPLSAFTPFNLNTTNRAIIAPFFADVDTGGAGSGLVKYGNDTLSGRTVFCVNWVSVGYYEQKVDKLNSFQLVLIDRSDTGPGNFDIEFNYNQIVWETGDASGGSGGLGGDSARTGYANGTMTPGSFLEFPGSAVNGGLLDTNLGSGLTNNSLNSGGVPGRYIFAVRGGIINDPPTIAASPVTRQQGTSANSTIANVNDAEDAENTLAVTVVGPATVNGVTISGISVSAAGVVTANVAAACTATNASFTLQVTDSGSLSATATLNVTVTPETTPPVINPIANIVATLPPNTMATSMPVFYPAISASDNCSAPTITVSPPSGSIFPVGTSTVTVTATDAAGNTSTATFTVTVQYLFLGFTGRVSNPPATTFAIAGNMIPISFSLSGFKGYGIFAAGSPSSQRVNCMTGTPIGASSPASLPFGLIYMPDSYSVYWQTNAAWRGTCREFSVSLNDGSTRTINFRFYD